MEPAPPPSGPNEPAFSAPTRGIAVASVSLGYFSLIVFFWKPFGMWLGAIGLTLGLISLAIGNKGGRRGENLALAGTLICSVSLSITTTVYVALGAVMWRYFPW